MSVTEEIKARLDIVTYIDSHVTLKKSGRYHKACCPFHAENTPSFVVNEDRQSWRCFGACAEGGDLFSFAMKYHGWSFSEALQELGKQAGVEIRQQSPAERQKNEHQDKLRGLMQSAADYYHQQLLKNERVLAYVRQQRGLGDETIESFGLGYAPDGWQNILDELRMVGYEQADIIETGMAIHNQEKDRTYDRFRNRLMIPIRDERGRVIGFGARALNPEDNPKYLNSPQTPLFDKSHVLFGLDAARRSIRDTETAVIVEGYMDVIQAHQAGFTNVVAQMGTAMTETQLGKIAPRHARKIILALDADAAGQSATRRSLETARQTLEADYAGRISVDIRILQSSGAKDPDDIIRETPDEWQALVDGAVPVADFVIDMEVRDLPPNPSIQEREAVAKRVLPLLVASESDLYQRENLQKLAMRLKIGERDLLRWASTQKPKARPASRSTSQAAPDNMPPPLDYDSLDAPPDEFADNEPETEDNQLERYCLRLLFEYPEGYYRVNRRLRELILEQMGYTNGMMPSHLSEEEIIQANQQAQALRGGPLRDMDVEDFSRSDYRVLMQVFLQAVDQHQVEVLDFMEENSDYALRPVLRSLIYSEMDVVRRRVGSRLKGEREFLINQYSRKQKRFLNDQPEIVDKALKLRYRQIERVLQEYQFIQRESQEEAGNAQRLRIIGLLSRARSIIEPAIEKQQELFL